MRFSVRVPADSVRTPQYMEQALAATHAILPHGRVPMTLECLGQNGRVILACSLPRSLERVLPQQIYAYYPDVQLDAVPEEAPPAAGMKSWSLDLHLERDLFLFPCG